MSLRREINKTIEYKRKTKNFLFPLLETTLIHTNKDINYLIDVLIVQGGFPQIVTIFDNIDYEPLAMDIYRLNNNNLYIDSNYDDDDKEVCLFFDIPSEFRNDYKLYIQGKYSQFSDKYKQLLTKTYGPGRMDSINEVTGLPHVSMYDAIYPTKDKRLAIANSLGCSVDDVVEVLSPPDINLEEYRTIEQLKELYGRRENIPNLKEV